MNRMTAPTVDATPEPGMDEEADGQEHRDPGQIDDGDRARTGQKAADLIEVADRLGPFAGMPAGHGRGGSPRRARPARGAGRAPQRTAPPRASGSGRGPPGRHRRRPERSKAQSASARSGCSAPGRRSAACRAGRRASAGSPRPRTAPRWRTRACTRAGPPRRRGGPRFLTQAFQYIRGAWFNSSPSRQNRGVRQPSQWGSLLLTGIPAGSASAPACGPRPAKPNGLSGPILGCRLLAAAYLSRRPSHSQWERLSLRQKPCRFNRKPIRPLSCFRCLSAGRGRACLSVGRGGRQTGSKAAMPELQIHRTR